MSRQLSLTEGSIIPLLLRLSAPLLLASLLQQLYNIANSMVVSHLLGGLPFAALGVADSITNLYTFVLTGACLGASVLVAQFYGEGNHPRLRQEIYVGFVLIGSFTLVIVLVGLLFLPQILSLIRTPDELMTLTTNYLRIMLIGMVFCFCYNYLASILRAIGNTRAALYFLLISLGYNLVAAWTFVGIFHWGIEGVALATLTAQLLSALLCFIYIRRTQPTLAITRADCVLDATLIKRTISFSAISALHQSSLYLGKLLIQSAVNDLETVAISAFTAATRVENLIIALGNSGSESIAIFVAQNHGAGLTKRARDGFNRGFAILVILAGPLSLLFIRLCGAPLLRLFLTDDIGLQALPLGLSYLNLMGLFFFLSLAGYAYVGYFRGIGRMDLPFIATTSQITVRVILTYVLVGRMGLDAVAYATGAGWILINFIHGTFYYRDCKYRKL